MQYQMVQEQKLRTRSNDTIYQVNLLLELMQVRRDLMLHYFIFLILKISESELKDFENVCSKENMVISDEFKRKVLEKDELKQILDIEVKVK